MREDRRSIRDSANSSSQSFICTARASPGSFTVLAGILKLLPAAPAPSGTVTSSGQLAIRSTSYSNFTAPLTAGGNLDGGIIAWSYLAARYVAWQ